MTRLETDARKYRLYIALYARGGKSTMSGQEDEYHWALIVGPRKECRNSQGKRFHIKKTLKLTGNPPSAETCWTFEEIDISMAATSMILTRVLIGKVKDLGRLRLAFQRTPLQEGAKTWNWVNWVEEAYDEAIRDGGALSSFVTDWRSIRDTAMLYVVTKKSGHRFDGTVAHDFTKVPTWNMLRGVETTS